MLLDIIREDHVLTGVLLFVGIVWVLVFLKNVWRVSRSAGELQQQYEHILDGEEYKVKGRFEQ